jgi:hypothetical protein
MEYPEAPPQEVQAEVVRETPPPAGSLWRDQVLNTVDQGLGSFLGHVEVEPSLDNGHFTGFRIVKLVPVGYWEGVALEPGDVVTRINGTPIERETEAYNAFESLRTAPELKVSYLRAGKPGELVYKIVERNVSPAPTAAPASAPATAPKTTTESSVNVSTSSRAVQQAPAKPAQK